MKSLDEVKQAMDGAGLSRRLFDSIAVFNKVARFILEVTGAAYDEGHDDGYEKGCSARRSVSVSAMRLEQRRRGPP